MLVKLVCNGDVVHTFDEGVHISNALLQCNHFVVGTTTYRTLVKARKEFVWCPAHDDNVITIDVVETQE